MMTNLLKARLSNFAINLPLSFFHFILIQFYLHLVSRAQEYSINYTRTVIDDYVLHLQPKYFLH